MLEYFDMIRIKYIVFSLLFMTPFLTSAQKAERNQVKKGNKQFVKEKFTEAEIDYRKALEINPLSKEGAYNLGNALFKQKKTKEAVDFYQKALIKQNDPLKQAQTFHNLGNAFMANQEFDKAVDSYKNALRINSLDDETRYNLAAAQAMLKKQQQENKNDQNKDKDKDKDKQKNDDQEQQQQQQQDDQEKKNNKQEQRDQQQAEEQVTKEKARQLLDALSQDEKDTQEKVKKLQMQQSKSRKTDKDW